MSRLPYQDQSVAVLGLGRSGEAAAALLTKLGARVTALDSGTPDPAKLRARGMDVVTGPQADEYAGAFDFAVLSPGIDPATPLVRNFLARKTPIISEIELAQRHCAVPVVAITGTNGKTTTTELVAAMFTSAGVRTEACGNIGKPYSEVAAAGEALDVITLEVSSFQLERIVEFRPVISVWLNFTPDHLDRYADEAEYRAAKLRIFDNQTADDFAIINARDVLPPLAARRLTFSAYDAGADLTLRDDVIFHHDTPLLPMSDVALRGRHNAENLMAALGVGLARGLAPEQMVPALRAYRPQPHRCEWVRELDGVVWINDSKATNLDALEKALLAETRPVVLIAGGKDKGFPFDTLTDLVADRVRWVVLIGEMAERIAADWRERVPCDIAPSLAEAVQIAWSMAQAGETVLFSPGTSSFDMFKSYADRGDQYRALVRALSAASN